MKLLLVTDSHGKKMETELVRMRSSLEVYSVIVARRTSTIRGQYREELQHIIHFNPDLILMHMGHNDVVYHSEHNTSPLFITAAFHQQMELAYEITMNFPEAKLVISSMLPKTAGSGVTEKEARPYNRIAKRFGQMLVKESYSGEPPYFSTSMNKTIWASISQAVANTSLFDLGGLHLNQTGKRILAQGWLEAMDSLS
jgi:hypothetical protein